MRQRLWLLLAVVLLFACSFPAGVPTAAPSQAAALPPATLDSSVAGPTAAPSITPSPTLSPTPTAPQVTPISVNVNCRLGPDVAYNATSALLFGQTATIIGRNDDSSWWYIADPAKAGQYCWVAASVVSTAGNLAGLPIIAPPAPIVTKVTVEVSLPSTVACGGPNPLEFSGTITTNGKATVKYQWEIGGDRSNTTSPETLDFNVADTKDVSGPGALSVDCGNYTITLHVLSPNDISATKKFKVQP